jgi:hypothetical protein
MEGRLGSLKIKGWAKKQIAWTKPWKLNYTGPKQAMGTKVEVIKKE